MIKNTKLKDTEEDLLIFNLMFINNDETRQAIVHI